MSGLNYLTANEANKKLFRWFESIFLRKKEVFLLLDFRPKRKVEELGCGVIGNTRLFGGRILESYSSVPTKPQRCAVKTIQNHVNIGRCGLNAYPTAKNRHKFFTLFYPRLPITKGYMFYLIGVEKRQRTVQIRRLRQGFPSRLILVKHKLLHRVA